MRRRGRFTSWLALTILALGFGTAYGQQTGSIVGWGEQVVVQQADLDSLIAVAGGEYHSLGLKKNTLTAIEWPGPGDASGMPRLAIASLSPNPFNPVTHVSFQSQDWGRVTMEIYDVTGRLVRSVPLGRVSPGPHTAVWDGSDAKGASVSSGVYFIRLRSAVAESQPVKAVIVR